MNKFNKLFYERVLYPFIQLRYGPYLRHGLYGINIIKVFKHLNKSQWLTREEIRSYQNDKLRRLIEHVYHNVPYYKKVMKNEGIEPQDIRSTDDLKYFPLLTKKVINSNYQDIQSDDIYKRSPIECSTGGTTGKPLKLFRDKDTRIWAEAARLRGWSWAQYQIGKPAVSFQYNKWPSLIGKIRIGLINEHAFPDFGKEDEIISSALQIRKINPFCVTGISSYLYRVASIYSRNNINGIQFPVIFTTSEMLYEYQRDFLEIKFNGKVYDQYGCVEIGSLAYECDHNSKHITDEHVIVETINSKGANVTNTSGHLIITDLDNYSMPFIRYRIGDVGTLSDSQCQCGRGLGILRSMDGREQEIMKTSDGNYVPAIYFPTRFKKLKGIEQYQIVQNDIHHITLKIVKNTLFSPDTLEKMLQEIKEIIGNDVTIAVEECNNIPLTSRGKTRLIISHVPVDF